MATWQFDCILIPRESMGMVPAVAATLLRDGSAHLWREHSREALLENLDALGAPGATWNPGCVMWGAEDGTCLEVAALDAAIEEVRLRVDMRSPGDDLLRSFLRAAKKVGLLIVTELGDVVEPELDWLLRAAERSVAERFTGGAEGYLNSLRSAPIEQEEPDS
jgi:hypothetical protein